MADECRWNWKYATVENLGASGFSKTSKRSAPSPVPDSSVSSKHLAWRQRFPSSDRQMNMTGETLEMVTVFKDRVGDGVAFRVNIFLPSL